MQMAVLPRGTLSTMASKIQILSIEKDGEDWMIVTFTDGTVGAYLAEELLELKPWRERVSKLDEQAAPVPSLS